MKIYPIHSEIQKYLKKRGLMDKFDKQKRIFESNPFHPGLETELLEPKLFRFWSFRIDQKYWAIFIFRENGDVEIIDVNNHYQ